MYQFILACTLLVVYLLIPILMIKYIFKIRFSEYHSQWNILIDDFEFSTKEFYSLLKVELSSHGIENVTFKEVKFREGTVFSAKRVYLRIGWKNVDYYICTAPFAHGFFVSWWLFQRKTFIRRIIGKIPIAGDFLDRKLFPNTFYTVDTTSMFMSYAQSTVLKVIDDITETKGVRLSEQERKPIMKDIFKR